MIPTFGGLRNMDLLLGKFSGIQKEEGRCVLESK